MDPHEETSVEETAPVAVEETPEEGSKILTDEPVHSVQVDGLALLKIIKHCHEEVPTICSGQLLGLDVDGVLEVTNCYPMPTEDSNDASDFQLEMMRNLRRVNCDNNTTGWYTSTYFGQYLSSELVDTQFHFQKAIPSSVVLVYDPFSTKQGRLQLAAFRLKTEFMELYSKKTLDATSLAKAGVISTDIFEELPVKVHNSHVVHAFLYELRQSKKMTCDYDRLYLASSSLMQKNLDMMSAHIESYAAEQNKFMFSLRQAGKQKMQQQAWIQKRKQENEFRAAKGLDPLPEMDKSLDIFKPTPSPSRLDSLLLSQQIDYHCAQLNSIADLDLNKLYIVQGVNDDGRTTSSE